jgi:hypothetical protein
VQFRFLGVACQTNFFDKESTIMCSWKSVGVRGFLFSILLAYCAPTSAWIAGYLGMEVEPDPPIAGQPIVLVISYDEFGYPVDYTFEVSDGVIVVTMEMKGLAGGVPIGTVVRHFLPIEVQSEGAYILRLYATPHLNGPRLLEERSIEILGGPSLNDAHPIPTLGMLGVGFLTLTVLMAGVAVLTRRI